MKISDKGIKMIKHHEGVRYKPYRCSAFLHTIGVGHVLYPEQAKYPSTAEGIAMRKAFQLKQEDNRKWTEEEVDALLRKDIIRFERAVNLYLPVLSRQCEFDAALSATFNMGTGWLQRSTFRQALLRGDKETAMESLLKCCKAAGKVIRGLQIRREDERRLFEGL
jgi:lysozyme